MGTQMFDFIVAQGPEGSTAYLGGEIDFAATLELGPRIEEIAATCNGPLLVDLSGVTFIDSEGIKMLIVVFDIARQAGRMVRISAISDRAQRVMEMAGVAGLLMPEGSPSMDHRVSSWRASGPELGQ